MMASWIEQSKKQIALARAKNIPKRRPLFHALVLLFILFWFPSWPALLFISVSYVGTEAVILSKPKIRHGKSAIRLTVVSIGLQFLVVAVFSHVFYGNENHMKFHDSKKGLIPGFENISLGDSLGGTSGDPRLLVGPTGAMKSPFLLKGESVISLAIRDAMEDGHPYITGDGFSIVIPVRNEEEFVAKTIKYAMDADSEENLINEIVVVDDASAIPISEFLEKQLTKREKKIVKIIRYEEPQGLIRAKIAGADASETPNIFFLDGHCRPKKNFLGPILQELKINYKRIICPIIEDIHETTWEDNGTQGSKMMFDWNFEFGWIEDTSREVPVLAGGILGITRKWWDESGKYDPGMLEWGGENIEQSFRTWLCGGEIFFSPHSRVGHIFNRPPKPNPGGSLVRQVQTNQKRAALVWLDDYYKYFETIHPVVKTLDEGPGIEERLAFRHKMKCKPFQWYVNKFRLAFESKGLLIDEYHPIQHEKSHMCLTVADQDDVILNPCTHGDDTQLWSPVAGNRAIQNRKTKKCMASPAVLPRRGTAAGLKLTDCKWQMLLAGSFNSIYFQFDSSDSKVIFNPTGADAVSPTGNDPIEIQKDYIDDEKTVCVASGMGPAFDPHADKHVYVERCVLGAPEQTFHWMSVKLMHEGLGHTITLEVKSGQTYRGFLSNVEDNMNVMIESAAMTERDGRVTHLEQVYIRGSQIRLVIFPDMLRHAPMFKLAQGKSKLRGLGLGGQRRAIAMRARATSALTTAKMGKPQQHESEPQRQTGL